MASSVGFTAMALLVKILSENFPMVQLVFFRSIVNFAIVGLLLLNKPNVAFPKNRSVLIWRGLCGLGALYSYFTSLQMLPVSIASVLINFAPLFVLIFSRVFLGEILSLKSVFLGIGAVASLSFVLLIGTDEFGGSYSEFGIVFGLLGSAFGGMAYTMVRAATARFSNLQILFYFTGISSALTLPFLPMTWVQPQGVEWMLLSLIGLIASGAQYGLTQAMRLEKAGKVGVLMLLAPVLTISSGVLFFDENFSIPQVIGFVVVLGCLGGVAAQRS